MRLLQLDCEVFYKGRGQSYLERGDRLIIIKDDNSVSVHQDSKISPLNYMREFSDIKRYKKNGHEWMEVSSKDETIKILIHEKKENIHLHLTCDSTLEKKGTEAHLQKWLSNDKNFKDVFGINTEFIRQELDTGNGSCDLVGYDHSTEKLMLIEVKRNAKKQDIYQVVRYDDAIHELYKQSIKNNSEFLELRQSDCLIKTASAESPVQLYLVASEVKKGVREEGELHNINVVELGYEWFINE